MDFVLRELIEIYKPNGIDWMEWERTKRNPYTYHHILEARNNGRRTVENGAILTKEAHAYLNYLDREQKRVYSALNGLFKELNATYRPPTGAYFDEVDHILKRVR